jgi:hypothetical protein
VFGSAEDELRAGTVVEAAAEFSGSFASFSSRAVSRDFISLISRSMSARLSVAVAGWAGPLSVVLSAFAVAVDVICAESETDEITTTAVFNRMRLAKDLQRLYSINLLSTFARDSDKAEARPNTSIYDLGHKGGVRASNICDR